MRTKTLILCALLLAFMLPAEAQWRVGASGGGDYNWFSINKQYLDNFHYEGAWGWNAAVFGQYNFMDWLGLRFEIEAVQKNHRFYRDGRLSGTNYVNRNTYMQLPVMAQFSFGGQKVRGFVNLGIYGAYWIAGRQKGGYYELMSDRQYNLDQAYTFQREKDQRWDFGLAGGLGIEYRFVEHWALHAEARCYYSFISTVKPYMQYVKDNRYNTTLGIQAGFAYLF